MGHVLLFSFIDEETEIKSQYLVDGRTAEFLDFIARVSRVFFKGLNGKYLCDFVGHIVAVATVQLCHRSVNEAIDNI